MATLQLDHYRFGSETSRNKVVVSAYWGGGDDTPRRAKNIHLSIKRMLNAKLPHVSFQTFAEC